MDPAPSPTPVAPATPPPTPSPITSNSTPPTPTKPFNKNTLLIGGLVFAAILILAVILILLQPKQKSTQSADPNQPTSKTWELTVSYDPNIKQLTATDLQLLDQTIRPDPRTAEDSSYALYVLNKDNQILYKQKVLITENLIFDTTSDSGVIVNQPPLLNSIIFVPHFITATNIKITKLNELVLDYQIPPQKTAEMNLNNMQKILIPEVQAQFNPPPSTGPTTGPTPQKLQVVFISDGFTNMNTYHQAVDQIKNAFNSTQPYASANPPIFEFHTVDNQQTLGCTQGIVNCANNPSRIYLAAMNAYPNLSKIIVIVNNPSAASVDGPLYGLTNDVGGNLAIFTNRNDVASGEFTKTAVHEFLGHAVGELYDRYVFNDPQYQLIKAGLKSNCTDNPQGEAFWRQAGVTGAYRGCGNNNNYAPAPPDCTGQPNPQSPLINGGNRQSIMSASGCGGNVFDAVEQYWIRTHIIPRYQVAITASPLPSTFPIASPSTIPNNNQGSQNGVTVNTTSPTNITSTSARLNGSVNSLGSGTYIREETFQYYDTIYSDVCQFGTTGQPVLNPNCKYADNPQGNYNLGQFSRNITGLILGHTYAVRAYAIVSDNQGSFTNVNSWTGWGNWVSFVASSNNQANPSSNPSPSSSTPTSSAGSAAYQSGSSSTIRTLKCSSQPNGVYVCQEVSQ